MKRAHKKKAPAQSQAREHGWKRRGIRMTVAEYEKRLAQQNGVCALCSEPPKLQRLNVDHDHKTKKVRSLLCWRCNKHMVSYHTIETATRVLAYLKRHAA